ncbi:MAG: hypothetical protein SA339_06445 [Methanomassiliicoccus sp.]|nr:hypothetical protein [Methanomassiliicoccus sp.]
MKSESKKAKPNRKMPARGEKPVKAKPIKKEEEDLPSSEELVEDLDTLAEGVIFGKNQNRTYALRDVWFPSLMEVINDKSVPRESREEMLFLTLTNALLDMTMDVVPEDMALAYARNLDDYITVTIVNSKYGVDLLKTFREDFKEKEGENFASEEKLVAALSKFEEEWWSTPRDDLDGKTPNDALEEMAEKYGL